MARNIDDIQRDIERTRRQLASTLDELAVRSKPANLVGDAKREAGQQLKNPAVIAGIAGAGALVVGAIVLSVVQNRKKKSQLHEIRRMLAARVS